MHNYPWCGGGIIFIDNELKCMYYHPWCGEGIIFIGNELKRMYYHPWCVGYYIHW